LARVALLILVRILLLALIRILLGLTWILLGLARGRRLLRKPVGNVGRRARRPIIAAEQVAELCLRRTRHKGSADQEYERGCTEHENGRRKSSVARFPRMSG
jgi:hypothetical protein